MGFLTKYFEKKGWSKLHNASIFHHQLMKKYLEKRGWVVFYLEPQHRNCGTHTCWMEIYNNSKTLEKK